MKPCSIKNLKMICDSPVCDWAQDGVAHTDIDQWLNKPCPKCGENLLTDDDMKRMKDLVIFSDVLSQLIGDVPDDTPQAIVRIQTHGGYSLKKP